MAARKKAEVHDPRERGTFEIQYMQGGEWVYSSTRYSRMTAQLDADDLEAAGRRVRIVKKSDKTAHDQDD